MTNEIEKKLMREMRNLEARTNKRIDDSLAKITAILEPIAETYASVSRVGRWAMALAVFVSIVIGIILSIKTFFTTR